MHRIALYWTFTAHYYNSLPQAAEDSTHVSADSTSNTNLLQVNDSENLYLEQEPYDHEEPSCST